MPPARDGVPRFRIEHGGVITPELSSSASRPLACGSSPIPASLTIAVAKYVTEPGLSLISIARGAC